MPPPRIKYLFCTDLVNTIVNVNSPIKLDALSL